MLLFRQGMIVLPAEIIDRKEYRRLEDAAGGVRRGFCHKCETSAFVHYLYPGGFHEPVILRVLNDAQGVNPQIPEAESSGDEDGIFPGQREVINW